MGARRAHDHRSGLPALVRRDGPPRDPRGADLHDPPAGRRRTGDAAEELAVDSWRVSVLVRPLDAERVPLDPDDPAGRPGSRRPASTAGAPRARATPGERDPVATTLPVPRIGLRWSRRSTAPQGWSSRGTAGTSSTRPSASRQASRRTPTPCGTSRRRRRRADPASHPRRATATPPSTNAAPTTSARLSRSPRISAASTRPEIGWRNINGAIRIIPPRASAQYQPT